MERNILIEKLKAIGFTQNESSVYLAVLENGTSPVSRIAEAARINRVSVYSILEKLLEKGLVSMSSVRDVQHFTALAPELLVEDARQKAERLREALPLLRSLTGGGDERPTVRYFEGFEGVKHAYRETLKSGTEILNYANSRNIRVHWPEYDSEYVFQRKERKIFLRGLAPDDPEGREVKSHDHQFFRKMRLLPKKHFQVENEIKIFDDKLFIASFEPKTFALLVQSQAVADTQRQIFEITWSFALE